MSAESPRHARSGGPLSVPSQPPSDRSLIDAVSGFINDVTLSASSAIDPKDVIQWARFETADINEPTSEGDSDTDISPLLLILGYGSGVQVWLIPPTGEAQEVLSWRQGTVRVLRILPTPQHGDSYASKRPLIALCDSASPGPPFCSLSFISIRGGEQVKSIKFKNQILDVLANQRSVVVSFSERFAVFDAGTLEDRMAVTTCFPCPCPLGGGASINPLALGDRWLAYADKKLNQSKRSSGGCEGEGVSSYTATVLHAAKSLSKGLRGLGESVAHSLAGRATSQSPSPPNADALQPGVVTILDIEGNNEEDQDTEEPYDPIVAHFVAHSDAIIALKFDTSGMLLVTADRRGHDFHVFRINPHPCGPGLASVHHLYILHRGDTTAKVQDIAISPDSRWAAISTLRGTTHIFSISPYGGACGVRTHTSPRVVNRLSRFHRSAGLPIHTASQGHTSGSPVSDGLSGGSWFPNPRLPPYPLPTTATPLAQLRPTANLPTHTITRNSSGRQRLSSLSEDVNSAPLLCRARFGPAPAPSASRAPPHAALYLVAHSGCLSHIALHPRPQRNIPKEKVCDETPIELEVEPIAQWPLQRPAAAVDLLAPLPPNNPLLQPLSCRRCADMCMSEEERWLSQVEIVTHAGPHRRLWMGPQFVFKTYNCTGSNSSLSEAETVEVEPVGGRGPAPARSNPVNMPGARPVLVDSGSASSLEHSPSDSFRRKSLLAETGRAASVCDVQLKEDLAEAMKEDQGWRERRDETDSGRASRSDYARAVDPAGTVTASNASACITAVDPDSYTTNNADEATFRPVVRAPAPIHPEMVVRPLPRTTTIPVQTVSPMTTLSPDDPIPLNMDVVIPAALTTVQGCHASDQLEEDGKVIKDVAVEEKPAVKEKSPIVKNVAVDGKSAVKEKSPIIKNVVVEGKPAVKEKSPLKGKGEEPAPKKKNKDDKADKSQEEDRTTGKQKVRNKKNSINKTEKPVEQLAKEMPDKTDKPVKIDIPIEQKEAITKTNKPTIKVDEEPQEKPDEPKRMSEPTVNRFNVDVKTTDVNKDLKRESSRESARERLLAECAERENVDSKSLPKSNRPPDDIQPVASARSKKSPTPKSVSDRDSEVSYKDSKRNNEAKEVHVTKEVSEPKEIKKQKEVKETKGNKEVKAVEANDKVDEQSLNIRDSQISKSNKKESLSVKDEPATATTLKLPNKTETEDKSKKQEEINTEEQAWDLLLTEPEKPFITNITQDSTISDKIDDKPKVKRNRKLKKPTDDVQTKADEDSFIEIHAIDEKQQPCNELVSISTPFKDIESTLAYSAKAKKSRSPKGSTFQIKDEWERKTDFLSHELSEACKPKSKRYDDFSNFPKFEPLANPFSSAIKAKKHVDGTASEFYPAFGKEVRPNKSKSLSPYPDLCKREVADVYVIDTTEEHFPEIQITKTRKRSPQPEKKVPEKEPVERPTKSWSFIAASKKAECVEKSTDTDIKIGFHKEDAAITSDEDPMSSTNVSLQEKLFELCKRTDILVAQCDTPTDLNFVDEHHSDLDLPPLEPLDFGLDDFKLEVMRDSFLDVNDTKLTSPICKINIDDILSSIKETTSKVIESSTFNLIDLEKVPAKKEKGFSVIESHKITSQEFQLDDDKNIGGEVMEKSSDDDVTSPIVSTDSDKEDKKATGAANTLPSIKQQAKSKKSRRKKK